MRVDDATQERAVGGWRAERAVGGWRAERAVAAGEQRGKLVAGQREANREVGVDPRRGSQDQTPEQRGEAAWDRVQRE